MVQTLPACREGDSVVIPNAHGDGWQAIQPEEFASRLTQTNQQNNGRIVPLIKLAKTIIREFPQARQLTGYHVEALAVEVFQNYNGPRTLRDMVTHLFRGAAERVTRPIVDSTGQSMHVDDSLGAAGSLQRSMAADSLARVARRMRSATSLEQWRSILGVD